MVTRFACAMVLLCTGISAQGAEIFRWVDDKGVTHYGEEPPAGSQPEYAFDLPAGRASTSPEDEYFSVVNQSRRMEEARLARERARSEIRSSEGARRSQQPGRVVYLDGDGERRGYGYGLPAYGYPVRPIDKRSSRRSVSDCRLTYIGCRKTLPPNRGAFGKRQLRNRNGIVNRPGVRTARARGRARP
jgi:hypothetical protein